eukprot:scaffold436_cov188-Alexandrium_tamarense.AAC.29
MFEVRAPSSLSAPPKPPPSLPCPFSGGYGGYLILHLLPWSPLRQVWRRVLHFFLHSWPHSSGGVHSGSAVHATLVTIWNLCIEFDCIHSAFTTVRHKSSSSASTSASTAASNDAPSSVLDPDIVTKLKVFKHKWSIMEGCCPICGDHGGDQCPGLFCAVETCVASMMRRSPYVFPFSSILNGKSSQFSLPFEIILDSYTREPWSQASCSPSNEWQSGYLLSTDGRNRLPGFLQYLRTRKKAAVSKFETTDATNLDGGRAMLVVPYDPPPVSVKDLPYGVDINQLLFVKYLRSDNLLKKGKEGSNQLIEGKERQQADQHQKQQIPEPKGTIQPLIQPQKRPSHVPPKKSGGLLGSLLGAQRRTENHLDVVRAAARPSSDLAPSTSGAAGAISSFRDKISSELEKFQSDATTFVTKITISLASLINTVPQDERDKATMDVFKYVVYEQVEEVGEDKWIAAKENGAFIDECVIAVYKEGHCPSDVLEDLNKGELPDEVKGQARHMVESQSKAIQRKDKKQAEIIMKQNITGESNVTVLNTNKRDRRTLEQIQKDMLDDGVSKKSRFD